MFADKKIIHTFATAIQQKGCWKQETRKNIAKSSSKICKLKNNAYLCSPVQYKQGEMKISAASRAQARQADSFKIILKLFFELLVIYIF